MMSDTIKKLRQKLFLSQEEFAKELCVSVSTINRWETGKVKPNITAMKKIKNFCNKNNLKFDELESEWLNESQG
mgnify:FL=1